MYHKVLTSTTKVARVPATAEYFTKLGIYVVDPIGKVEESRALVEERVVLASEGVNAYGVDPSLSIPRGELSEDVAVKAPSDTKYQQVTGPRRATASVFSAQTTRTRHGATAASRTTRRRRRSSSTWTAVSGPASRATTS